MAKIERTKNAFRNIAWGVIEKCASLLIPFITRTVFIKVLGSEYLGLNSLFTSILSVLSITELGFGTAIVFSMYKPIAEGDDDTIRALLNAYRKIYLVVGTIILTAGLAVLPFLPKLIKGSAPADVNLYVLYGIHLFDTVAGYYLFSYKASLFSAHQRNDLLSKRRTIVSLGGSIAKIAALLGFRSYYAYAFVAPFATLTTNFLNAYLAKKMYPELYCKGTISQEMKAGIQKRIVGLISFKIYNVVFTSVDTIVISAFLGLTPLAIYNNYYYIQNSIVGFLTILTRSITAGIGNKMVTNSVEDNYRDFMGIVFMNGWLVSFCSVCLICLYQPFMQLWVGEKLMFPTSTMILMALYFFLPRLTTITYTYREAAGLWWEDRFRPLAATVVNLATNIILVKIIGMNGVIISTLICSVFINIPWGSYVLFKSYFHRSPMEYFGAIGYYVFITVIAGAVTMLACESVPQGGFVWLVVKGFLCLVISNACFFLCYRKKAEFKFMTNYASRVLKRFAGKISK